MEIQLQMTLLARGRCYNTNELIKNDIENIENLESEGDIDQISGDSCSAMTDSHQEDTSIISKHSFIFNALIGEGGFGRVLSGMLIQDRTWYAIKEINKCSVTKHQTGLSMLFSELKALQVVNAEPKCNFIVGMQAAFHDK